MSGIVDINKEGSCIEFLSYKCSYYGQYINEHITLFFDFENDELVGCTINLSKELMATLNKGDV